VFDSRAHTIVTVMFTQNQRKENTSMQSTIHLVDLAGRLLQFVTSCIRKLLCLFCVHYFCNCVFNYSLINKRYSYRPITCGNRFIMPNNFGTEDFVWFVRLFVYVQDNSQSPSYILMKLSWLILSLRIGIQGCKIFC